MWYLSAVDSKAQCGITKNDPRDQDFNRNVWKYWESLTSSFEAYEGIEDRIELKIAGGQIASAKAFPWHALIYIVDSGEERVCSGALVEKSWVVTAAHCLRTFDSVEVVVGEFDRIKPDGSEQKFYADEIVFHPDYDEEDDSLANDLALLKLSDAAWLNDAVNLICMKETKHIKENCILSGFGYTEDLEDNSARLMQGTMNLMPRDECLKHWANFTISEVRVQNIREISC